MKSLGTKCLFITGGFRDSRKQIHKLEMCGKDYNPLSDSVIQVRTAFAGKTLHFCVI